MSARFKSMKHQVDHCQIDHGFTAGWLGLVVLAQPTVLAEPAKGPFHHPAPGQHHKAMQLVTLDNLNDPPECAVGPIHKCPGIAAINPDSLQPPETFAEFLQHKSPSIAILDVGRVHHHDQDQAEGVNEQVPLTPRNLFSGVITTIPPFSAVLTLWLSRIAALGVGLCPALRRTCSRRRS